MLAKLTTKNRITLPRRLTKALEPVECFDVQVSDGQIVLTPIRPQGGDAVRAKLAKLNLNQTDIRAAVASVRAEVVTVATSRRKA